MERRAASLGFLSTLSWNRSISYGSKSIVDNCSPGSSWTPTCSDWLLFLEWSLWCPDSISSWWVVWHGRREDMVPVSLPRRPQGSPFDLRSISVCPASLAVYPLKLLDRANRLDLSFRTSSPGWEHKWVSRSAVSITDEMNTSPVSVRLRFAAGISPLLSFRYFEQRRQKKDDAYRAAFNNLSECSLNFRISGSAPRCRPGCIVMSRSFPVCLVDENCISSTGWYWTVTSPWSSRVAPRSTKISTPLVRCRRGSSSEDQR